MIEEDRMTHFELVPEFWKVLGLILLIIKIIIAEKMAKIVVRAGRTN